MHDHIVLVSFDAQPAASRARVDISASRCADPAHFETILAIVEASVGGAERFNADVEALLARFAARWADEERHESGAPSPRAKGRRSASSNSRILVLPDPAQAAAAPSRPEPTAGHTFPAVHAFVAGLGRVRWPWAARHRDERARTAAAAASDML